MQATTAPLLPLVLRSQEVKGHFHHKHANIITVIYAHTHTHPPHYTEGLKHRKYHLLMYLCSQALALNNGIKTKAKGKSSQVPTRLISFSNLRINKFFSLQKYHILPSYKKVKMHACLVQNNYTCL